MNTCWYKPQHLKSLLGGISSWYNGTRNKYQIENVVPWITAASSSHLKKNSNFWGCPLGREGDSAPKTHRKRHRKLEISSAEKTDVRIYYH